MVVENITEGNYVDIYSILSEDIPNKYEVDGGTRYNENDGKLYYEIRLENYGKSVTIADISTNSNELKFNLKNLKIELPKHTNEAFSEVKVYIPIKENLEEINYDLPIVKKYTDGSVENWMEYIGLYWGYDEYKENSLYKVNDVLSQDNITIKYSVNYYYNMAPPYNSKEYSLPCETYQKEDGTWTSDAVDNFEKYVDQVVEKVDIKGFVNNQDFDVSNKGIHRNIIYAIGFIVLVGIVLLFRFVLKVIKNKQEEDY